MKKYIFLVFVSIFILFSCRKPLEIEKDFSSTKPVLNCYFSPQDSVFISLTQSMSPLSYSIEKFEILQNAKIELFENSKQLNVTFVFENDFYKAQNFEPKPKFNYKIKVTTENKEIIEAEDSVINTVPIINMSYEKYTDEYGYTLYRIFTNFTDPKETTNYYWLNLNVKEKVNSGVFYNVGTIIYCSDPILSETNFNRFQYLIFSDKQINGLNYNFTYELFLQYDSTQVIAKLNSISEDLYNYLKSYKEQTTYQEINNPLEEPTPIFTNIEGGLGIFGAYNSSIDTLIFATEIKNN